MIAGMEAVKAWADVATALVSLGIAVFVISAGARRNPVNLRLAILSGVLAANLGLSLVEIFGLWSDRRASYNATLGAIATGGALAPFYLLFVSKAVNAAPARLLARAPFQLGLAAWALAALVAPFLTPTFFVPGPAVAQENGQLIWGVQPAYEVFRDVALFAAATLALLCAILAWRAASAGSLAHARARSYAIAFGVSDLSTLLFIPISLAWPATIIFDVAYVLTDGAIVVTSALLARALVRDQLFDFELRVKSGVRRGTLAAAFAVTFVVAEQLLGAIASQRVGFVGGILAAIFLAFAFRPLDRLAQRFADAAMPGVAETPEYLDERRRRIYRSTLENALADGAITAKERAILDTLARELGMRPEDARAVERAVGTSSSPSSSS